MDNSMEAQDIRTRLEQFQANQNLEQKKTMSVPEMRRLLGLKKRKVTGWFTGTSLRQRSLTGK